jgi:hypothetical protein
MPIILMTNLGKRIQEVVRSKLRTTDQRRLSPRSYEATYMISDCTSDTILSARVQVGGNGRTKA